MAKKVNMKILTRKFIEGESLSSAEKKQILFGFIYALCVRNHVHFELIQDWLEDQVLTKNNRELLRMVTGYASNPTSAFISLFAGGTSRAFDHEDAEEFYRKIGDRETLLRVLKITPAKIEDLFVSIRFNLPDAKDFLGIYTLEQADQFFSDERLRKNIDRIQDEYDSMNSFAS